ncbi:GyrI-like domain-containing protein [Shewanella surugensis]|uniref:GyrI-like domain-containing protein n=1 Tax=Shewanella surugensis TaxID=212020 RepID=A0ABT0L732_9GAMM|nr:GyrI-like domain-containing protein [Shewanella surugensis]MCL1123498.1 GyrI-like domain-containing protein [Shewanella surugensis]
MRIEHIETFSVAGLAVRTKNALELAPSTAKISSLWELFNIRCGSLLSEDANVYGVYTHYESDVSGEFDIIACADTLTIAQLSNDQSVLDPDVSATALTVSVESGKYLVFSAKGKMPQTVIQLWGEVWRYFNAYDCGHIRNFNTDFEYYKSDNEVEIAIGIE